MRGAESARLHDAATHRRRSQREQRVGATEQVVSARPTEERERKREEVNSRYRVRFTARLAPSDDKVRGELAHVLSACGAVVSLCRVGNA